MGQEDPILTAAPGRRKQSRWQWTLAGLALVALLLAATHALWLTALGRFLVDSDPPAPADLAVVLAGDLEGHRIVTAANLVQQGLTRKVLVSGPDRLFGGHECDFAIAYAIGQGFPAAYFIPAPNEARSTVAEARALLPIIRKLGAHRVAIVTTNFHTRRARQVYHQQAPDLDIRMIAAAEPEGEFRPETWWRDRENRKTFLMEWMKTFAGWLGV